MAEFLGGLLDDAGSALSNFGTKFNEFTNPTTVPQGATYTPEQLAMARATLLGNLGATLLSAAQGGQSYNQRAQTLGNIGNAVTGYSKQLGLDPQSELARMQVLQAKRSMAAQEGLQSMLGGMTDGKALGIPDRQFALLKALPGPLQQDIVKGLASRDPLQVRQAELAIQMAEINLSNAKSNTAALWQGLPGAPAPMTPNPLPSVPASTLPRSTDGTVRPIMSPMPDPSAVAAGAAPTQASPAAATQASPAAAPFASQPVQGKAWWQIANLNPEQAVAILRLPAAQRDATIAELMKKEVVKPEGLPDDKVNETEKTLRTEFNTQTKDYVSRQTAYKTMQDLAKQGQGASDIALVISIMKVFDPTSTVTAGEAATARNAAGVPANIISMYNTLLGTGALSQKARDELVNAARQRMYQEVDTYDRQVNKYRGLAEKYGKSISPDRVVVDDRDTDLMKERATYSAISRLTPDAISKMGADDIGKLQPYVRSMSQQQQQQLEQRIGQLRNPTAYEPSLDPRRGSNEAIQRQLQLIDMRLSMPTVSPQERAARMQQRNDLWSRLSTQPM